jgi:hypothetical protein
MKMRKYILILSVIVFSILFLSLAAGIFYNESSGDNRAKKPAKLPDFELQTIDFKSFSTSEIDSGPLLVVNFNPECEHCKYEIKSIIESGLTGMGLRVILITRAPRDTVIKFCSDYSVLKYPAITVLLDSLNISSEKFGTTIIPSNYIYNKSLCLVKVLEGEYKPETIIRYLSESE